MIRATAIVLVGLIISISCQAKEYGEIEGVWNVVAKSEDAQQLVFSISAVGERDSKYYYDGLLVETSEDGTKFFDVCRGWTEEDSASLTCSFSDRFSLDVAEIDTDFCAQQRSGTSSNVVLSKRECESRRNSRCVCYVVAEDDETPGTGTGGSGGD